MKKQLHPGIKIINVISRKGGVGKTTLALGLGRLLLGNEYFVMYFDLDLTGTQAQTAFSSLPFGYDTHNVKYNFDNKSKDLNIPVLFDEYLNGKFSTGENYPSNFDLVLDYDKINVFNSFIPISDKIEEDDRNDLLIPSILFDDLHSGWFIEFFCDLVNYITNLTYNGNKSANRKIIFILDNAPGFSNYEPDLEDFLTDLGPEVAKFLYVTSLDTQDIEECFKSIKDLYTRFKCKLLIGDYYKQLKNQEKSNIILSKNLDDQKDNILKSCSITFFEHYFNLLLSYEEENENYERSVSEENSDSLNRSPIYLSDSESDLDRFLTNPEGFIQIIINKIPLKFSKMDLDLDLNRIFKLIYKGNVDINFTLTNSSVDNEAVLNEFPILNIVNNLKRKSIPFNSETELQYIDKIIQLRRSKSTIFDDITIEDDHINYIKSQVRLNTNSFENIIKSPLNNPNTPKIILERISSLEESFDIFISMIQKKNREAYYQIWHPQFTLLGSISSFLDISIEELSPNLIIPSDFENILKNNLSQFQIILSDRQVKLPFLQWQNKIFTVSALLLSYIEYYGKTDIQVDLFRRIFVDFVLDPKKSRINNFNPEFWIMHSNLIKEQFTTSNNEKLSEFFRTQTISPDLLSRFFKLIARFIRISKEYSLLTKSLILLTQFKNTQQPGLGVIREVLYTTIVDQITTLHEANKVLAGFLESVKGNDDTYLTSDSLGSIIEYQKIDTLKIIRPVINENIIFKWELI